MIRSVDQSYHRASFACNSFHASYSFTTFHAGILFNLVALGVHGYKTLQVCNLDARLGGEID